MILSCLLAAALAFSPEDAKAAFDLTADFVRENPSRDAGTGWGRKSADWLVDKAAACGVKLERDAFRAMTPKGEREFTNLHCPFECNSNSAWTVFVSHYDTKPGKDCPGANDGGSTSCLLIRLAKIVAENRDLKRNVMFIWTDSEECMVRYADNDGFQGSRRAAEMLRAMKLRVDGVYVLDMLGDRDLMISVPGNSSGVLVQKVLAASDRLGMTGRQISLMKSSVLDDHVAFMKAGFKAVDLIDFEYGSKPGLNDYWHTPQDTVDKLSADSFLTVGRLVCAILNSEAK